MKSDKLDAALAWQGDHLSEVALTALADGQDAMLADDALGHAASCEACARKMGELAELSIGLGDAMRELPAGALAPVRASARPSSHPATPAPGWAIAAALVVAVVGLLPRIADLPARAFGIFAVATRGLPVVVRGVVHIARSASTDVQRGVLMATLASALVLVTTALLIVRGARRAGQLQGA